MNLRVGTRVLAGAALLVVLIWYVDPPALAQRLRGTDGRVFLLVVLVGLLSNIVSALRWRAIAAHLGLTAPRRAMLLLYARGMTANALLPGSPVSGDVVRSVQLSRLGNGAAGAALSVLLDRISGIWILCGVSLAATVVMLLLWQGQIPQPHAYAYIGGLGAAVCIPLFMRWTRSRRATRALLVSAGYSLAVQLLAGSAFWLCARAAGVDLHYLAAMAAAAPIFIMAALPIGLAGFGTREAAAIVVLGALAVPSEQAVAIGLLYGVAGVIQGVLVMPAYLTDVPPVPT